MLMLSIMSKVSEKLNAGDEVKKEDLNKILEFLINFADKCHHGKEEDIMFRVLNNKGLSEPDRRGMNELIAEHVFGRSTTRELVEANTRYRNGDSAALDDIVRSLRTLADFYPRHIEKEDKVFFPAVRAYFSEAEDQAMLAEFWEFDRKMIHEKYKSVVDILEGK